MRYCDVPRHVYVHVPFCARRCSYCDFSIAVRRIVPVDEYLHALESELRTRFGTARAEPAGTLYFGGGTPSRLGGDGLARAVGIVGRHFPPESSAEITIEVNPEDVTPESANRWVEAGVNRVSVGAQTFSDSTLAWMHRGHGAGETEDAVRIIRAAGVDNVSLDLIFALPEALGRDFSADVERLLALDPQHVSLYGLTIEPRTPLGRWVSRGITVEQPEEGYESDFLQAHSRLAAAGFEHYEVSNYARPGRRAIHNSAYWSGVAYVGLGPSAHGFDGRERRWNARDFVAWRDLAAAGRDPVAGAEVLTDENRIAEGVYLGLRSNAGLALESADTPLVTSWIDAGWVQIGADDRIRCTVHGWLRLDALAAALTHHRSR